MRLVLVILTVSILASCAPIDTFNYATGEEFRDKAVEEATGEKITGSAIEKIFGQNKEDEVEDRDSGNAEEKIEEKDISNIVLYSVINVPTHTYECISFSSRSFCRLATHEFVVCGGNGGVAARPLSL